jgi:3-dehydroquinate dehydratase/shikimate dehydrogenase
MAGIKAAPLLHAEDLNCRYVFDLVYNPLETPLLRAARQRGINVITGVEMFVQQGARQFEIWTGKPAPEEEMLRVVLHQLRQNAEAAGEAAPSSPATAAAHPEAHAEPAPISPSAPANGTKATAHKAVAAATTPVAAPKKAAKSVPAPAKKPLAKAPAPAPAKSASKSNAAKEPAKAAGSKASPKAPAKKHAAARK